MTGIRAEPFPFGAPEYVDLELFLMWRARGMPMETPGVRHLTSTNEEPTHERNIERSQN